MIHTFVQIYTTPPTVCVRVYIYTTGAGLKEREGGKAVPKPAAVAVHSFEERGADGEALPEPTSLAVDARQAGRRPRRLARHRLRPFQEETIAGLSSLVPLLAPRRRQRPRSLRANELTWLRLVLVL